MNFIKKIATKVNAIMDKVESTINKIAVQVQCAMMQPKAVLADCRGNVITDHLGEIIVGIILVTLVVAAVKLAYPTVISDMITDMATELGKLFKTT